MSNDNRRLMQGNEAIARALVENGCAMATSYPGTPASEILSGVMAWQKAEGLAMHVEWAINEKVALEIAYAGSQSGLRTAVAMKQVGLNVASDPFMSAAYLGVVGGFIVISADDPGPHSSQTEQDSRLLAMLAKVPVLDPDSPAQGQELVALGYELSEAFQVPVMLRPTTRVCHACQDIQPAPVMKLERRADFRKEPSRWAATPNFRYRLHLELNDKLARIAAHGPTAPRRLNPHIRSKKAIVASGAAAGHAKELMTNLGLLDEIAFFQVLQPYPLHIRFIEEVLREYDEIMVLEETTGVIEMQLRDRAKVRGKLSGVVPEAGELLPELIEKIIADFAGVTVPPVPKAPAGGGRRPTLCPGCPHRASFYAIKKAAPKGIYPSDIGCYTLGANLGGVDTVLCMGAAVSQAAGFHHAYRISGEERDVVATIGDSTFFHAGIPPLIDAVSQNARFVLVILDNSTTAMTGNQPTPAMPLAGGVPVEISSVVEGCGVRFCRTGDPLDLPGFTKLVKEAVDFARKESVAVVIAKSPCLVDKNRPKQQRSQVEVEATCTGCRVCTSQFECPALIYDEATKKVRVDLLICSGCAVCLDVCPSRSITREEKP
ncbi:indolepyruvate:ferredoxin oxidoreductase, alpha subunit [Geotalea daltonii FRC-32]|uniref:Indolepyruvate oxidoreductase subunit IorA n=1 Tax=Geotalea daltonii (strain DSM 22248 / JCM 15807 / FRC-32) TaxID=316067 RepID=B9M2P1_GEODF|nr:thiamine pyrophosphate-dependent enzyme [Geotalea daltonii]ACM19420.1 indolepyruvate:ferredoxin oxidoreductase, alpha subunit [Geotalea daltonii FRC-32]